MTTVRERNKSRALNQLNDLPSDITQLEAAEVIGISIRTLYNYIREWNKDKIKTPQNFTTTRAKFISIMPSNEDRLIHLNWTLNRNGRAR